MKQALHIFKKDVRHLRYEIAFALLGAAVFAYLQNPAIPLLIWWFLIARVIHLEALVGSQRFWRTRPYRWRSLLGAKLLFILTFVNVPLAIAQVAIIESAGFSIGPAWAGLLWTHVLLVAAIILPFAALSAITSGLIEILTLSILLLLGFLILSIVRPFAGLRAAWGEFNWVIGFDWVNTYCVLIEMGAVAAVILVWQYSRRKTFATRLLAVGATLLIPLSSALLPWKAAFAITAHQRIKGDIDSSFLKIRLDSERKWLERVYETTEGQMVASLPLELSGLPEGTQLQTNGLQITLKTADGQVWNSQRERADLFDTESGIVSLHAIMEPGAYAKVKNQLLQIRGTLYFTLYGKERITPIPVGGQAVAVSGLGMCSARAGSVVCHSAFRPQSDLMRVDSTKDSANGERESIGNPVYGSSFSPFPAELSINPLFFNSVEWDSGAVSRMRIMTAEPIAHLRRDFDLENVRLSDFVVAVSRRD